MNGSRSWLSPRVLTRAFARHYVEMVVVMFVGMGVLALPAQWTTDALLPGVDGDDPTLMFGRRAVTMPLPMVIWMRRRGHAWRPCLEMAGAMIAPTIAAIALLGAGLVEGVGLLMALEHVAMLAVMVVRPEEYSGCHEAGGQASARGRVEFDAARSTYR